MFCMLMFFCAYLHMVCIFLHCCWPHTVVLNVPLCTQCSVLQICFVFGCLHAYCLRASYANAVSRADVFVWGLPGSSSSMTDGDTSLAGFKKKVMSLTFLLNQGLLLSFSVIL